MSAHPDPWIAALEEELGAPLPTPQPVPPGDAGVEGQAPAPPADPAPPKPRRTRKPRPRSPKAPATPQDGNPPRDRAQPPRDRAQPPRDRAQPPRDRAQPPHARAQPPHARAQPPRDRKPRGEGRVARRAASAPTISIPPELPIAARADDLIEAISRHQVIVVAGETGSGKSTQLPKLCLAAGRGTHGLIGHTQPRRLAARAVAERVAHELSTEVGELVGYQVRFTDAVSDRTLVKLMTDGILLNELQRDRSLSAYDTIIIDEAHERGLNIDFILGYLAQLLPRRPDLKVIITSATIDTERFAAHFASPDGTPAPIIEVSGRSYPVEIRYTPLEVSDSQGNTVEREVTEGIVDAVTELSAEGPGDVLVFASGERDIRDAADALRKAKLPGTEILPLYARLSAAEQHKVFAPHRGRRVVIATNIAETSLTVPGIRYVVDPGLARISRFSRRTKVQRLPIEKIARASADQRSGRCGRVAPGIAIRLYDEDDYAKRPDFTEPEILRTNLASVILQMTALGLGDVAAFPFVDRPDDRAVADGVALLEELGAITPDPHAPGGRALTDIGRKLARLPLDPRLARMVLAAEEEGCVHEVMVIASCLSIQDPRDRPAEKRHTAEQMHARFTEPGSDFLTVVNMWDHVNRTQRQLSGNQFRRTCREEFLHYLRIREWQDVYSQLRRVVKDLGLPLSRDPVDPDAVHRAMLPGLLSNIGLRDGNSREYLGTRGTRFVIGRQSALADKPPPWVVAAELVETNRLWAGMAAGIRPQWIEPLAGDLAKKTHGEPTWSRSRGAATVIERVTFRGIPIVAGRTINLSRVDPSAARRMLIQHALIKGDTGADHAFLRRNADRVAEVRKLEDRLRRRTLLAPEDVLFDFYDAHIAAEVVSEAHFATWWRTASTDRPHLLDVPVELLLDDEETPRHEDFPEHVHAAGRELPLSYAFDPAAPDQDGVTVDIPVELLPRLQPGDLDWLVPGMRHELVVALIRALPKPLRRGLVPAPDTATAVLSRIGPADGPLLPTLARELTRIGGTPVGVEAWRGAVIPDHLRICYRVVDDATELAAGPDLQALKRGVDAHLRQALAEATPVQAHTGLTAWTIGPLDRRVTASRRGIEVTAYPALVDEGTTVGVATFSTEPEQRQAHWLGTRRLLRLALPNPVRTADAQLGRHTKLALTRAPHPDVAAVIEDCTACVIDAILSERGGPVWTPEAFEALRIEVRERSPRLLGITARAVADLVTQGEAIKDRMRQPAPPGLDPARRDIGRQLGRLLYPGFVTATGGDRLGHLRRYLQGVLVRLETMGRNPDRDAEHSALVADLEEEYHLLRPMRPGSAAALRQVRWSLEELRISLFAQGLGTAERVSEARIRDQLARIRRQS
ncbi:ATP-dependent RNA helicase HrpA [soil metagenome]